MKDMETDFAGIYRWYRQFDDDHDPFMRNDIDAESTENTNEMNSLSCSLYFSQLKYVKASLQSTIICGIIFGLFATFLWWININTNPSCFGEWHEIPNTMHGVALISDAVKAIIIMFWPILMIAPICSWSMIKDSNLLFLSIIAGFLNAIHRLFLYIFASYEHDWKSYIGNALFSLLVFIVFYKFAKYRQEKQHSTNGENIFLITLKLATQVVLGLVLFLPYNYVVLAYYQNLTPILRVILSCSLIAVFYVPKLIISNVVTNLHGIYKPNESIVFAAGFLVISTMVTRLTQAGIENLTLFIIVSCAHGIFNVIDKLILPIRDNLCGRVCRRRNTCSNDSLKYAQQYIAHQSLISIITETTSVIVSNAAAYLLVYYSNKEDSTGKRYDRWTLLKEVVIRSSIAVSIEWFFNTIALKIQNDLCDIPVLRLWKREWKFILIIHLMQIIFVLYFADYMNKMFNHDMFRNSTHDCIGLFKLL